MGDGFFPLTVLNALKMVPEVCRISCATANPTEVVIAQTEQGRGIMGVVTGASPKGVETEPERLLPKSPKVHFRPRAEVREEELAPLPSPCARFVRTYDGHAERVQTLQELPAARAP